MNDERKPTFALFTNKQRKTDRSPEYSLKATCPHCGCEIRGAGWNKVSGKGSEYIGGPVEIEGENRKLEREPVLPKAAPPPDFNDEVPF